MRRGIIDAARRPSAVERSDAQGRDLAGDDEGCEQPTFTTRLRRHLRQLYWTVSGAVGLHYLHGKERELWLRVFADSPWVIRLARTLLTPIERITATQVIPVQWYNIEAVGHLALDFDSFLKNNRLSDQTSSAVFVLPSDRAANPALLDLWRTHGRFVTSEWLSRLMVNVRKTGATPDDRALTSFGVVMKGASQAHRVQKDWGQRAPLLELPAVMSARGRATLEKMGVPPGSWFVCVHNREGGYAPQYEWANEYRNSPIADLIPAMETIVARGGYCIRMGDPTMQPLPPLRNVIDYIHTDFRSDWMDVFLAANCRFFFGTSSGLYCVAGIFGRPSVQVNVTPMGCVLSQFPNDLSIPKMIRDGEGRVMPFKELLEDEASSYRNSRQFTARQMTHINNTPAEIVEVAAEMMDRLDNKQSTDADALQQRFHALLTHEHYSYHSGASVGSTFLKRHIDLLS